MNAGWILALAVVGQVSGNGWQASDWPNAQVAPSQYTAPANEISPGAAARYGAPQYAQPTTALPNNYDYSGQTRLPTIQPTPQPAIQPAAAQPSSQATNPPQYNTSATQPTWPNAYQQPRTADNRSAATANPYGASQQPASQWNQQPATANNAPQLNGPQNSTSAQQQYWQQEPTLDTWGNSRLSNTLRGSQAAGAGQPQAVDSKASLAAEYQSQVDDRWSFYSDFYRQPDPQLPTIPVQQPQYPYQNQNVSGAAVVSQPSAAGSNPYAYQNNQPNYLQPTYDPQRGSPNTVANTSGQPSAWSSNVYQPQSRPAETVASGATTLQPPLNSTLPAGGDNRGENRNSQFAAVQPSPYEPATAPRVDNNPTAWPNGDNRGSSWDNNWNNNVSDPRLTTARVEDTPANLNPVPTGGNSNHTSNFNTPRPSATVTTPKSNLLSSLTPKSTSQTLPAQYNQPLGSGKSGSGLFASTTLGQSPKDAQSDSRDEGDAGERPWGVLVASLFGLFFSVGANLYLGWIAFESHFRYRRLLIEGDDDDEPDSRRRRD